MTLRIRYRREQLAREIQAAQPNRYSPAELRDMHPGQLALIYREQTGREVVYNLCGIWYGMTPDTYPDTTEGTP